MNKVALSATDSNDNWFRLFCMLLPGYRKNFMWIFFMWFSGCLGPAGPDWSDIRGAEASHHGSWIKDHGSKIKDQRSWIKDHGSWIMDHGSRIMDQGSWTLDLGPCFGMNGYPGRDTDVISRLSKSTIEDLSYYIGFVTSRILDLVLA